LQKATSILVVSAKQAKQVISADQTFEGCRVKSAFMWGKDC